MSKSDFILVPSPEYAELFDRAAARAEFVRTLAEGRVMHSFDHGEDDTRSKNEFAVDLLIERGYGKLDVDVDVDNTPSEG